MAYFFRIPCQYPNSKELVRIKNLTRRAILLGKGYYGTS